MDKDTLYESSSNELKQRVVAKGSNVPEHIDSFSALKDRYQIPSHILQNLAQNGYIHPTGIQSYGIPILLEVRTLRFSQRFSSLTSSVARLGSYFPNRHGKNTFISNLCLGCSWSPCSHCRSRYGSWCESTYYCTHSRISSSNTQWMLESSTRKKVEDRSIQQSNCKYIGW